MRIALVAEHVDPHRGGAETAALELAPALADLSHDITVLHAQPANPIHAPGPQPIAQTIHNAGGSVRFVPIPVRGTKRAALRSFLNDANAHLIDQHYDIVHTLLPGIAANVYQPRGGTYPATIRQSTAAEAGRISTAIRRLARRFNRRQRLLVRLERELLVATTRVHVAAVSEYVRAQVARDYPAFPTTQCRVIFNACTPRGLAPESRAAARQRLRDEWRVDANTPLVLFIAHNFKLKGLATLLRALATRALADARLVVIGRGNPAPYAQLAQRLDCAARIHFAGPQRDAAACYAAADVLAHPTWYDPCSRVVLEALTAGLPVVTTDANGAAEILRGTAFAALAEPQAFGEVIPTPPTPGDLAEALRRALEPSRRAALARAQPKLAELLSMKRHARELVAFYEELLVARRD